MVLTSTPAPTPKRHSSEHFEKSSDDWSVTYKKLQPDLPSFRGSRKNLTKEYERPMMYDENDDEDGGGGGDDEDNNDDDDDRQEVLRRVKRKGRRNSGKPVAIDDDDDDECKLNLTSIIFSCGSANSLELVAECPPRAAHVRSGKSVSRSFLTKDVWFSYDPFVGRGSFAFRIETENALRTLGIFFDGDG